MRKQIGLMPVLAIVLCATAFTQNVEFSGGYAHISGDGGMDGYNAAAGAWLSHRFSLNFDYDSAWDNSHLGVFELTQTGLIVSKSHLQNYLVGPRIYFPGLFTGKEKHIARLLPFAEAEFGMSHLSASLVTPTSQSKEAASDNAFSWMVGGGADYRFSPHWATRAKLDFLRTHFADTGQSRVRFGLGVMYTFGRMLPTDAEIALESKRKADAERAEVEAKAEAQRKAAAEQGERNKLAVEEATAAKWKADADLAAAKARQKVAMEQLAAQESANASAASAAPPTENMQQAPAEAQREVISEHEREQETLRAHILERFNHVLPTTDTPRGLVVNMGDVLFDAGKSDLRPEGREDLARLAGIVLNYPSLHLTIEGHTDNTGGPETNQSLSEQRAQGVRDFLVKQGLQASSLSAQGLGENSPVADNNTAEGRQQNRRVEIIVSGEVIGTKIGK